MKAIVYAHELGITLLNESLKTIDKINYSKNPVIEYRKFLRGEEEKLVNALKKKMESLPISAVKVQTPELRKIFLEKFNNVEVLSEEEIAKIVSKKIEIALESGFVKNDVEAYQKIREFSLKLSEEKISEESTRLDLQAMQAIQAIDELDKMINVVGTRVKEWYSIHFPEILQFYDDPLELCKFVSEVGDRRRLLEETTAISKFSENRRRAILEASRNSRGGSFRDIDIERLQSLANLVKETSEVKKKMSDYLEKIMGNIAPNLTRILGPTIGARLMAKAGGLEELAKLPSSTIQILGAEKAIFRALKTGAKPPKHGIIFQHALVHGSPKWQRGKIARALASKIAIAARIDVYRKELDPSIEKDLMERIKEIRRTSKKEKVRRVGSGKNRQ
ncbi:MAG: C/D box methylation guide ribonucleoprotein complex aNOP56 subunit [Nitrososphaeria archaeon]